MTAATETVIRFDSRLYAVERSMIARLPRPASNKLPSRGQVATTGTINGRALMTVVEPDGVGGHWVKLRKAAGLREGETATLELQVTKDWPEPSVPKDLAAALDAAPPKIQQLWNTITPMARWEWVRWVNATANPETRERRIEVSISKMKSGKRRPCCFNLSACTDPSVSKNGRLIGL